MTVKPDIIQTISLSQLQVNSENRSELIPCSCTTEVQVRGGKLIAVITDSLLGLAGLLALTDP